MENFKRNHFFSVIDDIFSRLLKVIFPLAVLTIGKLGAEETMLMRILAVSALILFVIIIVTGYSILKWYRKVYYIKDNFIVIREGILVVKRREIPFNKVQTINVSQNIIQRIFNIAALKLDTGNSTYGNSEIFITIGRVDAELLREEILKKRQSDSEHKLENGISESKPEGTSKHFTISNRELLRVGLTSNAVFAGLAFIGSIYTLLDDIISDLVENSIKKLDIFSGLFNLGTKPVSAIILPVLAGVFVFVIFSFILSIVGTYVKYYGFSVKREGNSIIINYGLLEKKNYVLPVRKIKAVYIKQNLLRQVFNLSAINVESIGYGNENGEEAVLYPIATFAKRTDIISELLPEFLFEEEMIRVPKYTLRRFVISSSVLPLILVIPLTAFLKYGYLSLFLLPVFILKGFLEYKNSSVAVNDRLLCMSNKAFIKCMSLIAVKDIQSTSDSSNYFQRRKKLFNYEISIHSNTFGKTIKVKNLDETIKDKFLGLII